MFARKHGGIPCLRESTRSLYRSSPWGFSVNLDLQRGTSQQSRKFFRVHWPFVNAEISWMRTVLCICMQTYIHVQNLGESLVRRDWILIIGSGWPDCFNGGVLVLDNLSSRFSTIDTNDRSYAWVIDDAKTSIKMLI